MQMNITSPVDSREFKSFQLADNNSAERAVQDSYEAQLKWCKTTLDYRISIINAFINAFKADKSDIAQELAWCIGRPAAQNLSEVEGLETRARYMCSIAEKSLADIVIQQDSAFKRVIKRESLGVVFVIGAWNYVQSINAAVFGNRQHNCASFTRWKQRDFKACPADIPMR